MSAGALVGGIAAAVVGLFVVAYLGISPDAHRGDRRTPLSSPTGSTGESRLASGGSSEAVQAAVF